MEHRIHKEYGGKAETSWVQAHCSCGWSGKKHYAYEDYQHSNCTEEAARHHIKESL